MAFRYRKFNVYQDSKNLHKEIIFLVNEFPRQYQYLADQVKRSSLSIILNIAEGSSKQSDKDFNRLIAISLGSTDEAIASFEVALDLKLITTQQFQALEQKLESISKQLGGLSKTLRQ
ncbi:MAG TPA: four helix bundle protein [Patescibacteria group bacterium]|jgi:four helix bundle protein|nr:four helix bundle protein [Patescibacteria group bacterium]